MPPRCHRSWLSISARTRTHGPHRDVSSNRGPDLPLVAVHRYSSPHSDQTITRGRPRDGITTNLATALARYIIKEPASTPSLDNSVMRPLVVGQVISEALTAPLVPAATTTVSRSGHGMPVVSSAAFVSDSDTIKHAAARDLELYSAERAIKPLTFTG